MPTIKITPANSSITIGQTQSFTAEISDPVPGSVTTYKWFVDGGLDDTSAIGTFSLTPSTAGAKTIKVESTSTDSEAEPVVLTDETTLTVNKKTMSPTATIETDKTTVVVGGKIKFTAKTSAVPESSVIKYLWDSGETTESVEITTSSVGSIKKECTITITHPDYDTKEIKASSTVSVTAKPITGIVLNVVITPNKVKVGEEYEVEAIVTGGPTGKTVKYSWNNGQSTAKFKVTAEEVGDVKYECTITVDAENYLTFTTKSSHSVAVEKASPEYEEGCTKYIHPLDHRESAYLWQGWWVMKEIEAAVEKGIDWKNPDETELNYKCDLKTIAYMLDKFPNIEIQESKNGYILNKATIESGYIY